MILPSPPEKVVRVLTYADEPLYLLLSLRRRACFRAIPQEPAGGQHDGRRASLSTGCHECNESQEPTHRVLPRSARRRPGESRPARSKVQGPYQWTLKCNPPHCPHHIQSQILTHSRIPRHRSSRIAMAPIHATSSGLSTTRNPPPQPTPPPHLPPPPPP